MSIPYKGFLSFSIALEQLKHGRRVGRVTWRGDRFIFLVPGSTFNVSRPPLLGIYPEGTQINYHPHIDMSDGGLVVPWVANQSDLLTEDWYLLSNKEEEGFEP